MEQLAGDRIGVLTERKDLRGCEGLNSGQKVAPFAEREDKDKRDLGRGRESSIPSKMC